MERRRGRGGSRGGRGGRRDETRNIVTTKLFVGNLPQDISSDELRGYFEKYGKVTECDVVNEDFGFVHFSTPEEADAAVDGLNGIEVLGSRIRVQKSTSTKRSGGSGGGSSSNDRSGCFKCGDNDQWSKESESAYERGSRGLSAAYADPYDNPLIERYRRTIDLLHERIRYLEDLLAARAPALTIDPYTRPAPDYYDTRRTAATSATYEDAAAAYDSRTGGGKISSTYLSDSPTYRSRPY